MTEAVAAPNSGPVTHRPRLRLQWGTSMTAHGGTPNWEAFYANHRKPGYVPGFDLGPQLGGGACGVVYRAVKQSVGRDYAIKFLRLDDATVQAAVERELEQVRFFAQIDHPNLVGIEDRGSIDGIPYVVMAFAGQETLRTCLQSPERKHEALPLLLQACRGVAALHERGLVHFDLKPENVFVKGGVARVGDYGLSKLVAPDGALSVGRGTPIYMAPEMLRARGDHRSDIYSLGVMFYEVLAGRPPFAGATALDVLRQHESAEVVYPNDLPESYRHVLSRCLAKDPDQRFGSVDRLLEAMLAAATARAAALVPPVLPRTGPPPLPSTAATPVSPPSPATAAASVSPPLHGSAAAASMPPPLPGSSAGAAPMTSAQGGGPPPLPPVAPPRRRSAGMVLLVMAMFFGLGAYAVSGEALAPRQRPTLPRRSPTVAGARDAQDPALLRDTIQDLASRVDRPDRRGEPELRPLDASKVQMPADLALYRDQIAQLEDPALVRAGGSYERLGYPFFLAAVQWLQEQDYTDTGACRHAAAIHLALQNMTSVQSLTLAPPLEEVDAKATSRFLAAASGWRELAESRCSDPAEWRRFLQGTGKLPADPRKN